MKKLKHKFNEVDNVDTIQQIIERFEKLYSNNIAVEFWNKRKIVTKTYHEFSMNINSVSTNLICSGLMGKNTAVIGKNSYEWLITYLGVVNAGGIIVPLDKDLRPQDLINRITSTNIKCIVYDNDYSDDINNIRQNIPEVELFINMNVEEKDAQCIQKLMNNMKKVELPIVKPNQVATIVYTSGTTGDSKGVILTHENISKDTMCCCMSLNLPENEKIMLVLPLHHMFALTAGTLSPLFCGETLSINSSIKYISKEIKIMKPHTMVLVPMFIEGMYKKIYQNTIREHSHTKLRNGIIISKLLLKFRIDLHKKIFGEISKAFGGRLYRIIVGGASLRAELIDDFKCFGVQILQGYGITECSPVVSSNIENHVIKNSVGKVYPCCQVKIIDGEICVKGSIVMKGYYEDQEGTLNSFVGSWFKTGDLGYLNKDNYLFITGRKKNLIILENGENVSPEELEEKLYEFSIVKEVVVYELSNKEKGKIVAEIYPDEEFIQSNVIKDTNNYINNIVESINRSLPRYKQIQGVIIRDHQFEKTASQKIKRSKIGGN
jgi:long-chain acyl-CoA synthetase